MRFTRHLARNSLNRKNKYFLVSQPENTEFLFDYRRNSLNCVIFELFALSFQNPNRIGLNTKVLNQDVDKHPMKFVMRYKNENR